MEETSGYPVNGKEPGDEWKFTITDYRNGKWMIRCEFPLVVVNNDYTIRYPLRHNPEAGNPIIPNIGQDLPKEEPKLNPERII